MNANVTTVTQTDNTDKPVQTVAKRTDWTDVVNADIRDIVLEAGKSDEAIQKVLKQAHAVKPGDSDAKDKLAEVTRSFANLTFDTNRMSQASQAAMDFAVESRKLTDAHTRYRTRLVAEWLRVFPSEYRGMRTDLANALFGKASKGNLMSVKRDIDALTVLRVARERRETDKNAPTYTIEAARTLVTNASPEDKATILDNIAKGLPARADKSDKAPVPLTAGQLLNRLERVVDDIKRTTDITDEQRKRVEVVLNDALRAVKAIPTHVDKSGEAAEK